jgi:hypothetical protein
VPRMVAVDRMSRNIALAGGNGKTGGPAGGQADGPGVQAATPLTDGAIWSYVRIVPTFFRDLLRSLLAGGLQ